MPWISLPSFGKSSNVARTMAASADFETDEGADGVDVRFTGRLTLARLGDLPARLDALGPIRALDLSDIERIDTVGAWIVTRTAHAHDAEVIGASERSEEHTSELQSLMRISYAVFCLKKQNKKNTK